MPIFPGLSHVDMDIHVIPLGKVKGGIAVVEVVVGKSCPGHILFITVTNNKFVISIVGVFLHDVAENEFSVDFNPEFGL